MHRNLHFPPSIQPVPGAVRVSLVGAGPGAADLITLRGWRRLSEAEVVIHDELLTDDLLDAAGNAERIYVGKRAGKTHTPQSEICRILVEQALKGLRVVRLKGGDPMIFGRATEEIRALREAGIAFELVPGVTAASAAASAAGFSLTQRLVSSAVIFATGHECAGKAESALRWRELAKTGATLCLYMGAASGPGIARELIEGGLQATTAVAAISSVSHSGECAAHGTLVDLASGFLLKGLPTPVVVVIGEVAREASAVQALTGSLMAA